MEQENNAIKQSSEQQNNTIQNNEQHNIAIQQIHTQYIARSKKSTDSEVTNKFQ